MILRLEPVALRAAGGECAQDDDLRSWVDAGGGCVLPGDKEAKKVVELTADWPAMVEVQHVLAVLEVGCGLRQTKAPGALIAGRAMGVQAADRDEVVLTD